MFGAEFGAGFGGLQLLFPFRPAAVGSTEHPQQRGNCMLILSFIFNYMFLFHHFWNNN